MKIIDIFRAFKIICSHSKEFLMQLYGDYFLRYEKQRFGKIGKNVQLGAPISWMSPKSIFIDDDCHIWGNAKFIISPDAGKFIMKKQCGVAQGLTVVTNQHSTHPEIGKWRNELAFSKKGDINQDVIVEEDVWIASNVTLLPGVTIGRGAIVGSGAVCRKSVPPYAIVIGNPATVINFKYKPEEIIEHEKSLYSEEERLPFEMLEKNYKKFYLDRIRDIMKYLN